MKKGCVLLFVFKIYLGMFLVLNVYLLFKEYEICKNFFIIIFFFSLVGVERVFYLRLEMFDEFSLLIIEMLDR